MAKKVSGKHATPRKAVQIAEDWVKIGQKLAADRPMPLNWLIVELIKNEAERQGVKGLPPTPWDLEAGK